MREMDNVRSWLERTIDKIRSWPRWLRYGLVSGAAALIQYTIVFLFSFPGVLFLNLGLYTPLLLIGRERLAYFTVWQGNVFTLVFWFLLGGLLGRLPYKLWVAVLLWFLVQIIGVFIITLVGYIYR